MLETELKNNTAALAALAAAVADLTAAVLAMKDDDPVVVVPVDPAPASMPPVNPVPAADAPVTPAPASMPPVNPVPAASAPAPVSPAPAPAAMSGDDLRKLCVRAGAAGLTAEVVAFLSANGCQKLAQLPPEKYGDLVALLASKGVE